VKACNDEIEALRLKSSKLKKKVHTPALCSLLLRLLNDVSAHAHTQPSSPNPSSFKGKTTCARTNIIKKVRKANDEEKEERSKINALEREVPWLPTATRATSSPPLLLLFVRSVLDGTPPYLRCVDTATPLSNT
jgi:hypothetical protein